MPASASKGLAEPEARLESPGLRRRSGIGEEQPLVKKTGEFPGDFRGAFPVFF
jgi:hypothetical protein